MLNRDVLWGLSPAAIGSCKYCNREYTPEVANKLILLSTLVSCLRNQQAEAQLIVSLGTKLVTYRISTLHNKLRSLHIKQTVPTLSSEDENKLDVLISKINMEKQLLQTTLMTLFERTVTEIIHGYDFSSKTLPVFGFKVLYAVVENIKHVGISLPISSLDLMLELTILARASSYVALLPVLFDFIHISFSTSQHDNSVLHEIQAKLTSQYVELLPSSQSPIKSFASTLFLVLVVAEGLPSGASVFYPIISILDSINLDSFLQCLSRGPAELTNKETIRRLTNCMLLIEVMVLSMLFYMRELPGLTSPYDDILHTKLNIPCFIQRYLRDCHQLSSKFTCYVQTAIRGMVENPHVFRYVNTEEHIDLSSDGIHISKPEDTNIKLYSDLCAGVFSEHGFISNRDIYHIASWSFVISSAELFWSTSQLITSHSLSLIKTHKLNRDITTMICTFAPIFHKEVIGSCKTSFQSLVAHLARQPRGHQEAESSRIVLTSINRALLSLIGSQKVPISRGGGSLPSLILGYVNGIVLQLQQKYTSKDILAYEFLAQSTLAPDSVDNSFDSKSPNNSVATREERNYKQCTVRRQGLNLLQEDWHLYLNKLICSILNALLRNMATLRLLGRESDVRSGLHSMLVLHTLLLEATTPFEFRIFSRIAGEIVVLLERYGSKHYLFRCAAFSALMGLASRIARQTSKHQKRYRIEDLFLSKVFSSSTYIVKSDPGLFALLQILASCAPSHTTASFLRSSHPHVLSTVITCLSAPNIHLRVSAARAMSPIFGTGSNALSCLFTELESVRPITLNSLHGIIIACRVLIRPYTPFKEGRGHPLLDSVKVRAGADELAACKLIIEAFLSQYATELQILTNAKLCVSELNGIIADLT
ncbi:Hypothetical protein GLP15_1187 [Giardia lamblia P15]|uniref:tRNA (32-2'-O)-methyltransferase regulator THADA-like C-terminal TPR repeats region domain-containing protein n=1 Tax=Giardia intestinalis (strain P15) TaxID=658858 RepID=E1F1E4_GIAIA|nr:Hypothetical protein GLP15_1187 [Giardia lamblia P15]